MDITVTDVPEDRRYVARAEAEQAGFAGYVDRGGSRLFVHTEVGEEFGGKGVGSTLVRYALEDCRDRDLPVVPLCPFIASWIDEHPEFADVVDQDALDLLDNRQR